LSVDQSKFEVNKYLLFPHSASNYFFGENEDQNIYF